MECNLVSNNLKLIIGFGTEGRPISNGTYIMPTEWNHKLEPKIQPHTSIVLKPFERIIAILKLKKIDDGQYSDEL